MANEQNLIPAKKGEVRNPNGRPKGIKNWSTIVQDLLADEEIFQAILKDVPAWVAKLPSKNAAHAIVVSMQIRALAGDNKAAEWLRKTGFGDKLELSGELPILVIDKNARDVPTTTRPD